MTRPGVTRDRREGDARLGELRFRLFDTAGLDDAQKGTLEPRMSAQSMEAAKLADVILLVMDARAGVTPDRSRICPAHSQDRTSPSF